MKVCISVGGRFHAFNLAYQLHKHKHLERLITSYPRFKVAKFGIPGEKVKSFLFKEIITRAHSYLPPNVQWDGLDFLANDWFDRQASRHLPECDICTAWSGFGLQTIRRAKANGAITIIERGSSHIEYQRDILSEEYAKFGFGVDPIDPDVVEKELQEYEEADYIAIPSEFVKRTFLEKAVPGEKLIHTPYGVDLKEFRPLPTEDGVFRIINVGAQSIRKGTVYLLKAFTELDLPDAELLLVGPVEDEIKSVFGRYKGLFRHIDSVPQSQLVDYYARASVFSISSLEEGMAMVQAQAMACGLPVVCTTNTGGADIVRDGVDGFILPIRDIEALKEKLIYLYENRDACREMGENALRRVRGGFTWDDYGRRIIQTYKENLCGNDHPRSIPFSQEYIGGR
ncbi:MAG: glycosyltransferase family 4 protein [Candidatus Neomarinimicrobiota bacterium]